MNSYPDSIKIVEVGPRDGLQNEEGFVPTSLKIQFIRDLKAAGLPLVEATSFVRPDKIPQMKDAREVVMGLGDLRGLTALVPNERGLDLALELGLREISVVTAVSEVFNKKNINTSVDDSLKKIESLAARAHGNGLKVRGYISTVFGCPYEGKTSVAKLVDILRCFDEWGLYEWALGDTIGAAHPLGVSSLLGELEAKGINLSKVAMHFHDTRGMALANVLISLQRGISIFDSSAAGLGGCPYAEGASGNVATEDIVCMLEAMGIETGINARAVATSGKKILDFLGISSPSKAHGFLMGGAT